ncbi:5-formyltetrahydrofolate cyclo-ligase [Cytobacillus dafuensis]|uniref:5-formyltetrahydrofolate cyclo-ligase n=1 Tax=Cytobacillus dafuensis TaxID=1742359 RepID=A0A5B8Z6C8_CYTDA|nr:5-formyltetrahydrofolate cyclo-ligase [Cytobacillus dafuensis]QED48635.1 5-formyltetrahydrofolate cyclo-ligase [Cytobacillus dafuensis]
MKNEKQFLRKEIMAKLDNIEKPQYEHFSYLIAKNLYQDSYWKESKTIGITISKQSEVDTYQIIRKAWEEGKQIVIPKCLPKLREMVFRTFCQFDQLECVYSGLFEPIEAETEEVSKSDIDLLIIPGLAFTEKGFRLGFGGGYYDRYLTEYKGRTVSLAFHPQIVSDLPIEYHDMPVNKIITPSKVLSVND